MHTHQYKKNYSCEQAPTAFYKVTKRCAQRLITMKPCVVYIGLCVNNYIACQNKHALRSFENVWQRATSKDP